MLRVSWLDAREAFYIYLRRIQGTIEFHNEVLEESSSSQESANRKSPRKPSHSFKLTVGNYNLNLVEVHGNRGDILATNDSLERVFDAIF